MGAYAACVPRNIDSDSAQAALVCCDCCGGALDDVACVKGGTLARVRIFQRFRQAERAVIGVSNWRRVRSWRRRRHAIDEGSHHVVFNRRGRNLSGSRETDYVA